MSTLTEFLIILTLILCSVIFVPWPWGLFLAAIIGLNAWFGR
ncbi:hypothetical protein [Trinickia acidisoli]|nr:hypothetical protein [Trinickia acidisoli]